MLEVMSNAPSYAGSINGSGEALDNALVHPSATVESEVVLGAGVKVWHNAHVRRGAILEAGVSLGKDVFIDASVRVGAHSRIQNGVSVYQGVHISDHCFIGPHVIFTNDLTPRIGLKSWKVIDTYIDPGASIGAGSIIRCGVRIGSFAMVGAGAVVTKDVPAFHIAMGLPADCRKKICACGQQQLPLECALQELIQPCCEANLIPEMLQLAHKVRSAL